MPDALNIRAADVIVAGFEKYNGLRARGVAVDPPAMRNLAEVTISELRMHGLVVVPKAFRDAALSVVDAFHAVEALGDCTGDDDVYYRIGGLVLVPLEESATLIGGAD